MWLNQSSMLNSWRSMVTVVNNLSLLFHFLPCSIHDSHHLVLWFFPAWKFKAQPFLHSSYFPIMLYPWFLSIVLPCYLPSWKLFAAVVVGNICCCCCCCWTNLLLECAAVDCCDCCCCCFLESRSIVKAFQLIHDPLPLSLFSMNMSFLEIVFSLFVDLLLFSFTIPTPFCWFTHPRCNLFPIHDAG